MKTRSHAIPAMFAALLPLAPMAALAADPTQGITLAQESADQWRASKLVGVQVYGPDDKSVGKITDVLMGHDGTVQDVIVGVGGFLGIGEKDVAIPFAAVTFSDKPMAVASGAPNNNLATPPVGTMAMSAAPAASGAPNTTAAMTAANPMDASNTGSPAVAGDLPAGTAAVPPSTAYPDHGTIAFTTEQLKGAPTFKFAR